jgi:dinuclear metal center YbgI/SA1388 family protein
VARAPTRVCDLARAMEDIAPTGWATEWDNVGLLVGDPGAAVSRVLLTIDCTREVVQEAVDGGCEAIVSYHPPIFGAVKRFIAPSPAFAAARAGVAIYSPHTALDAAPGGTNDVLAAALGVASLEPLRGAPAGAGAIKLVTFVPPDHVGAVSQALFAAGAGHIGNYSSCSFRAPGTGTFLGEQGANPVVGQPGRLEEAAELRLETLVQPQDVANVVRALRATHPYEEPAFDLVPLAPAPGPHGPGRVGTVPPTTVGELGARLKTSLGAAHLLAVGAVDKRVERVALCVGSGGELLPDALGARADLFVTGELRHHDALRASAAGLAVICTLHSTSERIALGALEGMLAGRLPGVVVVRSRADREPFAFL